MFTTQETHQYVIRDALRWQSNALGVISMSAPISGSLITIQDHLDIVKDDL